MNNPQLADKVIAAMLKLNTGDSERISKNINEPHEEVADCMRLLQSTNPNIFGGSKGYGNSIDVFIRPSMVPIMKSFVENGGFTDQIQTDRNQANQQSLKEDLEVQLLKLSIGNAQRAKSEARISIYIAAGVLLFEIVKFFIKQ